MATQYDSITVYDSITNYDATSVVVSGSDEVGIDDTATYILSFILGEDIGVDEVGSIERLIQSTRSGVLGIIDDTLHIQAINPEVSEPQMINPQESQLYGIDE